MNTAQILDEVNARFYARFAEEFHQTRNHGWSGWSNLVEHLPKRPLKVFDLGCGNGRLAQFLENVWMNEHAGIVERYRGVDQCTDLLAHAQGTTYPFQTLWGRWTWADILDANHVPEPPSERYDWVTLFGVMHHIFGHDRRVKIMDWASRLLAPGGVLTISLWDFGAHSKWDKKTLPWEKYNDQWGLDLSTLEDGDRLLGWAEHSETPRYCHWMDRDEEIRFSHTVDSLCAPRLYPGQRIDTGKDLNRYWCWTAKGAD